MNFRLETSPSSPHELRAMSGKFIITIIFGIEYFSFNHFNEPLHRLWGLDLPIIKSHSSISFEITTMKVINGGEVGFCTDLHEDTFFPLFGSLRKDQLTLFVKLHDVAMGKKKENHIETTLAWLLISNGKFKSVEHRVLANSTSPRISVAYFFTTHFEESEKFYGPIKELVTYESPPLYKETSFRTCSVTEGERSKPVLKQNITMGSIS
ncbi:hypothetical protein G4B88_003587 [Cannabis sativa]|uniref:Isopenicillin N synthase-like Fe(2+) 2OG dioxygenase domain-containing protein n=1 Tax=Cannabis sativa TaxID=3483 RepID=A0A7J6EHC7_CANSA|nr:hypothetical protein G4B88_003587 [Cannabis sativa]